MAWFLVNSDDLRRVGGGPVDPGYGRPVGPGFGGPVDPGFGVRPPVDPGYGIPDWGGGRPDNTLPGGGGHPWLPGHGRPDRPSNELPGGGWSGNYPSTGLPVYPSNELPGTIPGIEPPPTKPIDPDAPLTGYIVVFVPGHGYKMVTVPVEPPVPPTEPTPK